MPSYLVEAFLPDSPTAHADAQAQARRAADSDSDLRHVRSTFLPSDEVVLHVFEAPSDDVVRRAAERVDLHFQRVVEAVEDGATAEGGR